ncbi:hypothetical protein JCM1840_004041 [Sporobolomyces johnsonii]
MPGKKPSSSSSNRTASTKTRSSSQRQLKPSLLSVSKPVPKPKKQRANKARDEDLRDELNGGDLALRQALQPQKEAGPLVKPKETPKELGQGGTDLAKALDELEMAFAA